MKKVFGCDLRSLAAFRIGVAALLLLDLGDRARDLRAHYTDWGVLPRGALLDLFLHPSCFSFHFVNGTWQWQAFLFLLAAVCALGLFLGYRTRLMTVASWVLLISVQNRNPLVLQGGDILFRMILFWAMFLPLGARCSLDRYLERRSTSPIPPESEEDPVVLSWATVAVLIQVFVLYFFAGILKTAPEWTRNSTAVYYAMSIDQLTTPLGHKLLGYPGLMKFFTRATLWIEIYVPFLFFVPFATGFFRLAAIVLFFGLQMAFGATIRIYIFPWICFVATFPLIPSVFWGRLPRMIKNRGARWEGFAEWLTERGFFARLARRPPPKGASAGTPRWLNAVAALFLVYVLLWNVGTLPVKRNRWRIDVPRGLKWIGSALRIDQKWDMFAPFPLKDDGWYVIPGTLADGREVDLFTGEAVTWEKPVRIAYLYKNQRWQKYMMNLWTRDLSKFREFYARYLCRSWNGSHEGGERLDRFTIYFMREDTHPNGEGPPQKVSLLEHRCP